MGSQRHSSVIQPYEFSELVEEIEAALVRFESTSNHAVLRLYRRSNMPSSPDPQSRHNSEENSLLDSADNEHVFLVYL